MTTIRIATVPPSTVPERSTTIDAVRALSLLTVIVLHALMVGAWIGTGGGLQTKVALAGETWFAPVTWVVQVMPLFFIAGGYVSLLQWRRLRSRGATVGDYVAGRVRRLAVPATLMVAAVGSALPIARVLGADAGLVAEASLRIGQPLWFLAVYIGATALVPAMSWLHERRPTVVLAGLALGALVVDLASRYADLAMGYVNLVFVWLLMQQLGFTMLDRRTSAWSRRALLSGTAVALGLLILCVALGRSPDMIENLNPPSVALVLLGAAQFFALQAALPWLDRVTARPSVSRVTTKVGGGAMSAYLWHMPLIMLMLAAMWLLGLPLPEPHSAAWWATRIPWLAAIFALVIPFATVVTRADRPLARRADAIAGHPATPRIPVAARVVLAVVLAIAGTTVALLLGLGDWSTALLSAALLGAASILSSPAYGRPAVAVGSRGDAVPRHAES